MKKNYVFFSDFLTILVLLVHVAFKSLVKKMCHHQPSLKILSYIRPLVTISGGVKIEDTHCRRRRRGGGGREGKGNSKNSKFI